MKGKSKHVNNSLFFNQKSEPYKSDLSGVLRQKTNTATHVITKNKNYGDGNPFFTINIWFHSCSLYQITFFRAIAELISHEDEKLTMIDDSDEDDDDEYDDNDSEMDDLVNGAHLNFPGESQRYENFRHSSSSRRTHQDENQQAGPSRGRYGRRRNYGVVPFPRF